MIALEILKRVSTECEAHENFMGYAYEANKVDRLIDRAIAELEEAMKPKECSKCKHIHQGWWCNENGIKVTLDFCCNRYKPKDNA